MQELPDVEIFRKYLTSTALHKVFIGVDILNKRVLEGVSARYMKNILEENSLKSTVR